MKQVAVGLALLVSALALSQRVGAESAVFGWIAGADDDWGKLVVCKAMIGPTAQNKDPGNTGPFRGEFHSLVGPHKITLSAVHLLKLNDKGELVSRKLDFKIGDTAPDPDKNLAERWGVLKDSIVKTAFQTAAVEVSDKDAFVLIFKNENQAIMVLMRISRLFVPS